MNNLTVREIKKALANFDDKAPVLIKIETAHRSLIFNSVDIIHSENQEAIIIIDHPTCYNEGQNKDSSEVKYKLSEDEEYAKISKVDTY